jgi:hypothetical protein
VLAFVLWCGSLACGEGGANNAPDVGTQDISAESATGNDVVAVTEAGREAAADPLAASHGKEAAQDYDRVFGDGVVHRIDLKIPAETYAAMLQELEDRLGTPEQQQEKGPPPKAGVDACAGLEPGTDCSFVLDGKELTGKCTMIPFQGGILFCLPPEPMGMQPLTGWDPSYVEVAVEFEGLTWAHVGMRFKGNSTLNHAWQIGKRKFSFRLHFDKYESQYPDSKDQRFWGFQELIFNSNWRDSSMIREKLACELFRRAGIPASQAASYRVFADLGAGPVYWGLYTLVEDVSDSVLDTQFDDDDGNLYKPDGPGADFTHFEAAGFPKKTNEEAADWSDVEGTLAALHAGRADPAAWRAELEKWFDTDVFIAWLALNTLIGNWDSYGNIAHNYYLYADPGDAGRLTWVPWDLNEAFRSTGGAKSALSLPLDGVTAKWPLIRFLMDDPVYHAQYLEAVGRMVEDVFPAEDTKARMKVLHELLTPYVVGPEGEAGEFTLLDSPDQFLTALDSGPEALLPHVDKQHAAAQALLGR